MDDPFHGHKAIFTDGSLVLSDILNELITERISIPYERGICGFCLDDTAKWISPCIIIYYFNAILPDEQSRSGIVDRENLFW